MERGGFTYIVSNSQNTVLYTGSTNDIKRRMNEHKNKTYPNSFSAKYNCSKLLYFKYSSSIDEAIRHEYEIKKWRRSKKEKLISSSNPNWVDLQAQL